MQNLCTRSRMPPPEVSTIAKIEDYAVEEDMRVLWDELETADEVNKVQDEIDDKSTSSMHSISSSVRVLRLKKARESHGVKDMNQQTFYTVTMGRQQLCVEHQELAECTMVHIKALYRYLSDLKT